jgi:hypothetical protein
MARLDIMQWMPSGITRHYRALIELLVDSAPTVEWLDPTDAPEPVTPDIPRRLYCAVGVVDAAMAESGEAALVAACVGSRSHDGFLRQRSIERLLSDLRPWTIPFVVEALGDYVIEIVESLDGRVPGALGAEFGRYLVANEQHFFTLCRRCVSYWNEYDRYRYESRYPDWMEYPGARVIADLVAAARSVEPDFGRKLTTVLPRAPRR